ncbi:MAG: hypothetical protein PHI12_12115 [Dehalococcoidales bacterium]|nr:hypothetical protein [Dehalococcoidales bacterium]
MKNKFLVRVMVGAILILSPLSFCQAEGTVTETWTTFGEPNKVILNWTTTTNGNATGVLTKYIRGEVYQVVLVSTSVAVATYSVVLTNSAGVDLLRGTCSALASNSTVVVCPGVSIRDGISSNVTRCAWNDIPTLSVTGLGTNCSGRVDLYWK